MVKHVCVAARIGEGKAPGEGNGHSIPQRATRRRVGRSEQVHNVVSCCAFRRDAALLVLAME